MRLVQGVAAVAAALLGMVAAAPVMARSWPQRPVKFIVPFGPGAGADIGARLISDRLAARWGKAVAEFVFEYFIKTAGVTLTKVPYRDIVQAATDVGEGRLQIYMASYAILQPQTEAQRIKMLVTTGRARASILPQVPTGVESGYPALEVEGLIGAFGRKGMANELRSKIGADIVEAANDPAISARLNATAQVVNPGGPQEFAASVERQRAQIARIAQDLGIKPKLR